MSDQKCPTCGSKDVIRHGRPKRKFGRLQEYLCKHCPEGKNRWSAKDRLLALGLNEQLLKAIAIAALNVPFETVQKQSGVKSKVIIRKLQKLFRNDQWNKLENEVARLKTKIVSKQNLSELRDKIKKSCEDKNFLRWMGSTDGMEYRENKKKLNRQIKRVLESRLTSRTDPLYPEKCKPAEERAASAGLS